jgi:hypothetical protein
MTRRFALLYSDGSLNVSSGGEDLENSRNKLMHSYDDPDTELVEVDIKIMVSHGTPKLKLVKTSCVVCPMCSEEIYFDDKEETNQ